MSDALNTVPKPANIGDPNPLTIRDVKREGKNNVLVDVVAPEAKEVSLFVEGPTPDWALPVPRLVEQSPPRGANVLASNSTACRPAPALTAPRSN